ncbi:MAG TPA: four helix bundle protein [Gemmatimonadales bacterium]|nr:four helix bundle protein [Gemmatimonadales bacterium]
MLAHQRLRAWQSAHQLALQTFAVTQDWPKRELYGLSAQTRRAALSVPTNIAEGAARLGRKEFARFLNIALGSLAELHYLLEFARDIGICEPKDWERLDSMRNQTGRLVWGLYRRVKPKSDRPAV